MKLAILGMVTAFLGLVLGVPGLVLSGGIWIPAGLLARLYFMRRSERSSTAAGIGPSGEMESQPGDQLPTAAGFWGGTVLMLLIAAASLAIGLLEIGFPEPDQDWRWVPIGVGALIGGVAALSGLMYLTGSGLGAVADAIGVPEHPAEVVIEAARETGVEINERPRLEFDLLVRPEGLPEYRVTKKATVPHTALGRIDPGEGFAAMVNPEKETAITIDWDAPIAQDADVAGYPRERLERLDELRRDGLITAEEHAAQRLRILDSL